jgi:hypothetical protein
MTGRVLSYTMRERINNLNKEVEQSRERKTGEDIKSSKYYF